MITLELEKGSWFDGSTLLKQEPLTNILKNPEPGAIRAPEKYAGKRVMILSEEIVFGRAKESTIIVNDPRASRKHCTLFKFGKDWRVVDSSSYGTTILQRTYGPRYGLANVLKNETPVVLKFGQTETVNDGDALQFGETIIKLILKD